MSFITVNPEKCQHDGACAEVCPITLIYLNQTSLMPEGILAAEERCIKCGHCVAVCPQGALSVTGIKAEDCPPVQQGLKLTIDQAEQLLKSRRSVRTYQDKKVEQELLLKLIDIARYAPSAGNSQQVQWLLIDSPEEVKKVATDTMDFFRILAKTNNQYSDRYSLPTLIDRWDSGIDGIFRSAPALIVAHAPKEYGIATIDCSIALTYVDIAATTLGLGCCWAGFFMIAASQSPSVLKSLDLPEGNNLTGALMIGYSKYDYQRIPPRKDAKIIWQ